MRTLLGPEAEAFERALARPPSVEDAGPDGWTAITVSEYALGWGKRVRGVINNAYPKGLRLR